MKKTLPYRAMILVNGSNIHSCVCGACLFAVVEQDNSLREITLWYFFSVFVYIINSTHHFHIYDNTIQHCIVFQKLMNNTILSLITKDIGTNNVYWCPNRIQATQIYEYLYMFLFSVTLALRWWIQIIQSEQGIQSTSVDVRVSFFLLVLTNIYQLWVWTMLFVY